VPGGNRHLHLPFTTSFLKERRDGLKRGAGDLKGGSYSGAQRGGGLPTGHAMLFQAIELGNKAKNPNKGPQALRFNIRQEK